MNKQNVLLACLLLLLFMSCKKAFTEPTQDTFFPSDAAVATTAPVNTKPGPMGVCYVEVNNHNILNTGAYTLKNGGQQLFDIAIVFAANLNYDVANKRAILFNNNNVTKVLTNRDTYIKPLQDKGLKVLLSILGNHGGAGISNFTSRADARDFAQQLALAVETYGLDGIDFDDEYSDYGKNGTGQPNDSSFVMLTEELRALMPDKIISFYYFGPATSRQSYNGKRVGDYVDYSWNASYGTYRAPNVPPLTKSQLGPAAVWINNTSAALATSFGTLTKTEGYGIYLYYDLHGANEQNYLSGPAMTMYGDSARLSSPIQPWSQGTAPDAPTSIQASNITGTSALLTWQVVNGVDNYDVEYRTAGAGGWETAASATTGTSVQLTNLAAATGYQWRIKSNNSNGTSTYTFGQFSTTELQGAVFFEHIGYQGMATREIPKGSYKLEQLKAFGFNDNWASSALLPEGWKVTMYKNDSFKNRSWILTASESDFTLLSPSASEQVTSVVIE